MVYIMAGGECLNNGHEMVFVLHQMMQYTNVSEESHFLFSFLHDASTAKLVVYYTQFLHFILLFYEQGFASFLFC